MPTSGQPTAAAARRGNDCQDGMATLLSASGGRPQRVRRDFLVKSKVQAHAPIAEHGDHAVLKFRRFESRQPLSATAKELARQPTSRC